MNLGQIRTKNPKEINSLINDEFVAILEATNGALDFSAYLDMGEQIITWEGDEFSVFDAGYFLYQLIQLNEEDIRDADILDLLDNHPE